MFTAEEQFHRHRRNGINFRLALIALVILGLAGSHMALADDITDRNHNLIPTAKASSVATAQILAPHTDDDDDDIPAATRRQLARARRATAKYRDVERAVADGFVNIDNEMESGEGFHFVNFSLLDATFDIEHPEVLLYAPGPDGRLKLVGVEYAVPLNLSSEAPEGFIGDDDVWREDTEMLGLWELNVWLWLRNPEGVFADRNPRIL